MLVSVLLVPNICWPHRILPACNKNKNFTTRTSLTRFVKPKLCRHNPIIMSKAANSRALKNADCSFPVSAKSSNAIVLSLENFKLLKLFILRHLALAFCFYLHAIKHWVMELLSHFFSLSLKLCLTFS